MRRNIKAMVSMACCLFVSSCIGDGASQGACVSTPVDYTYFVRKYCYNGFSKDECSEHNRNRINDAEWLFYEDQTCKDRGLAEGSN